MPPQEIPATTDTAAVDTAANAVACTHSAKAPVVRFASSSCCAVLLAVLCAECCAVRCAVWYALLLRLHNIENGHSTQYAKGHGLCGVAGQAGTGCEH